MGRKWDNRANYDKSMKLGILTKFDLLYIFPKSTKKSDFIMTSLS